jgi:hypothetical protein
MDCFPENLAHHDLRLVIAVTAELAADVGVPLAADLDAGGR